MNDAPHSSTASMIGFGAYTWTSAVPQPRPTNPEPPAQAERKPVMPPGKLTLTVREAAQVLGVSVRTVRRLIDRRLLRPSVALRHVLIPHWEIERFLKETSARG